MIVHMPCTRSAPFIYSNGIKVSPLIDDDTSTLHTTGGIVGVLTATSSEHENVGDDSEFEDGDGDTDGDGDGEGDVSLTSKSATEAG